MPSRYSRLLPADWQDAYFQLVYYPTVASAGIANIYTATTRNHLYAKQGRPLANLYAKQAEELFEKDKRLTCYYNDTLANGKWKNMMSDIHIGYTQWSMPKQALLPSLQQVTLQDTPSLGICPEGCEATDYTDKLALPLFDALLDQTYYIDLFNRGKGSINFTATPSQTWIKVSQPSGTVKTETRLQVNIDWAAIGNGTHEACLTIKSGETNFPIGIRAVKGQAPDTKEAYFGNLSKTEFSIPAYLYNKNVPGKDAAWTELPDLGRGYACMGISPVTAPSAQPEEAPYLEYQILLPDTGTVSLCIGILPTQDVYPERGLRIAVAIDDEIPEVIDARQGFVDTFGEYNPANLAQSPNLKPLPKQDKTIKLTGSKQLRRNEVFDNLRMLTTKLHVKKAGMHRLKLYMIDPGIVLEQLVLYPDNRYPSYFGAPAVRHQ